MDALEKILDDVRRAIHVSEQFNSRDGKGRPCFAIAKFAPILNIFTALVFVDTLVVFFKTDGPRGRPLEKEIVLIIIIIILCNNFFFHHRHAIIYCS